MQFLKDVKRTKIVATIGPASYPEDRLRSMILAGMNVARINFSHGDHEAHAKAIANIRRIAEEEGRVIAILGDLQGPKYRLGEFESVRVIPEDRLVLTSDPEANLGDMVFPLPHADFVTDVDVNQRILIGDGEIEFLVVDKAKKQLTCEVIIGGELKQRKGVSAPDSRLKAPAITEKDRIDLRFALEQNVDYLAMSFVRSAEDIKELRWLIKYNDLGDVAIIAKIEKFEALDDIEDIIDICDGIMVARGDLGVEIDAGRVPLEQKRIIALCNKAGKPVITATQMLESMTKNPRPTRAEASDVANAIFDGTDAVMLSGESASGDYPVVAVETMADIARMAEGNLRLHGRLRLGRGLSLEVVDHEDQMAVSDAISYSTVEMAEMVHAKMIVTSTWTGYTAQRVARERPQTPIICVTPNPITYRRMALVWGVQPMMVEEFSTIDEMIDVIVRTTSEAGLATNGDKLVIIAGVPFGAGGQTNFVKIHTVRYAN